MATVRLKAGADPAQVARSLAEKGITLGRKLAEGRYVIYVNNRTYMCTRYPALIPLYQEDRRFWKSVRKRYAAGEEVARSEIEAHYKQFKEKYDQIIRENA